MTDSHRQLLLSRREASAALGVSVDTVANLIAAGELQPVRIGKGILIRREDIEALITRGTAKTKKTR